MNPIGRRLDRLESHVEKETNPGYGPNSFYGITSFHDPFDWYVGLLMGIALLFSLGLIGFSTTASKITFERILQRSFLVLSSAFCLEQRFIRLVKLSREGMAALRVAPFDYQELLATTRRAPRSSAQPHTEQPKTEGNGYRCRGGH